MLQENVQFSEENPSPNYKPFDTAFESITKMLLKQLGQCVKQGTNLGTFFKTRYKFIKRIYFQFLGTKFDFNHKHLGIIPKQLDPVSITNQVSIYLQDEHRSRRIDSSESVMIYLSFSFDSIFDRDQYQNKSNQDCF